MAGGGTYTCRPNIIRREAGWEGKAGEGELEELRSKNSSRVAPREEPRGQIQPRCWMQQEQPLHFQVWGDKESTELGGDSLGEVAQPS